MPTSYWLIKSEASCYSIDDLKRERRTAWTGIRNYQARNYMRDGMKVGDLALFYHSNGDKGSGPTGVYGLAKVVGAAHPDETAEDPKDEHFDPGREWVAVDVAFVAKLPRPVTLEEIKKDKELKSMLVAQRGQRLSVMPVEEGHYERILKMSGI